MITRATLTIPLLAGLVACGEPDSVTADRYSDPDRLFSIVDSNVASNEQLEKIVEIDHSRLGAEAGSVMPPARVLLFSNPALESQLVAINPLIAVDLPMRVLAYEMPTDGSSRVIHNSFDYLSSRYGLDALPEIETAYSETMLVAIEGIGADQVTTFTDDSMQPDGITTLESPFDFEETVRRVTEAIDAQDDTVWFGRVDFQARAQAQGIEVSPTLLLLFGGPAPGAKAMASAPTLGLDAFCQKFVVWQDAAGVVRLSFNDLLDVADRQQVSKSVALRIINRRLTSTFREALEEP